LAFQNGVSSSGYLLPWLELHRAGFRSVLMSSPTMTPPEGRIGYVYSGADRNTIAWVLYGRVAAGATTRGDFEKLSEEQRAQLAVIYETIAIPRHIVVHRRDLAANLAARVTDILTTMHETEAGRKALAAFEGTEKFDVIPRESIQLLSTFDDELQKARLSQ
jgi:phosphonate transport system substrate-binding protein